MDGISSRHVSHQVAQKFRKTTLPRYAERATACWLNACAVKSGASLGNRPSVWLDGAGDQMGAAFIQQYFDLVQQVFKASIRKVTLTVHYPVGPSKREFSLSAYFTDDSAMEKVIGGFGRDTPPEDGK